MKGLAYIELSQEESYQKKIMIFSEGTVLRPKTLFSHFNHKAYIPIGDCVDRIQRWKAHGANIVYCTSLKKEKKAKELADLLNQFGFVGSKLYYREHKQKYKDIVELVRPDILIEDDCKSIGGARQWCITHVSPGIKEHIKSIVVKEFKGIDHLPADYFDL